MPFDNREVPPLLLSELQVAANEEGAWLQIVEGEEARNTLAELIAQGDRLQMGNKAFRGELASWIRPNRSGNLDGIPGYSLGFNDLPSYLSPLAVWTFDLGRRRAARAGSTILAVLGTEADKLPAWLAAGQALERVLLRARAEGVWASFLNQPVEVADLRGQLRKSLGRRGFPQPNPTSGLRPGG